MVPVICRTNLDISHGESWPEELPAAPQVGQLIQSRTVWAGTHDASKGEVPGLFVLELVVAGVTWQPNCGLQSEKRRRAEYICVVDLTVPPYRFANIAAFLEVYKHRTR